MISPLPRNKRAKDPNETGEAPAVAQNGHAPERKPKPQAVPNPESNAPAFSNNPFTQIDTKVGS